MISAVILTKNEENNIVDCIESLTWVDEIIVIDDNSDDRTAALAKTKGATVYTHSLHNDFSKQRNFGLEKAKGNWILFIDADERVSEDLKKEIKHIVRSSLVYEGYFIKRKDILWGNEIKHGENAHIPILRLAKKESGTWVGKVHETWEVHGKISVLQNELHHYPHQSMYEFLKEINFYTTIRAEELYKQKKPVYWWTIIIYPLAKFIVIYFYQKGILDGISGLLIALQMSFHSFLVRGKLWKLWEASKKYS